MRAVVIYESMYGNTHLVADAIASGLFDEAELTGVPLTELTVAPMVQATPEMLQTADLVAIGGPTHVHGMSRAATRKAAVDAVHKAPAPEYELDRDAPGVGIREWFASLPHFSGRAAAFDTRMEGVPIFTGRASKGIARQLRKHGFTLVAPPESFLVTTRNALVDGEEARAQRWGTQLTSQLVTAPATA
jgi:hypothetical protein